MSYYVDTMRKIAEQINDYFENRKAKKESERPHPQAKEEEKAKDKSKEEI